MIHLIVTIVVFVTIGWFLGNALGWYLYGRPDGVPAKYMFYGPRKAYRLTREKKNGF